MIAWTRKRASDYPGSFCMNELTTGEVASDGAARTLTIATPNGTRHIRLTRGRVLTGTALGALMLGWTLTATAGFLVSTLSPSGHGSELSLVEAAYEKRIASLEAELAATSARELDLVHRLDMALNQITTQQDALHATVAEAGELQNDLTAMRGKLATGMSQRDLAEVRAIDLDTRLASVRSDLNQAGSVEDIEVVLGAVSDALSTAVEERDTNRTNVSRLESEIATMELRMEINRDRQEQLVASLEEAVEVSFRPLEQMFSNSGLDVDNLVSGVRQSYTGIGGDGGPIPPAVTGMADPSLDERFSALMSDMDDMNMMRIAAAKVPFAMPVKAAHRFTSGFGTRRDPKTGGRRAHNGIDLAGPRGTHIHATAEGVVTFAGRQSGYGNLIKIRHAHGFETSYAHLNKIHVKVGDRIARSDHIGDMGTTGRSTGVHLHYEVRLGGKPVNPLTYIKAARDVF